MKNSKFSEIQIIKILSEQIQGKTVIEICREHGISLPTFTNGKVNMMDWMFSNFQK